MVCGVLCHAEVILPVAVPPGVSLEDPPPERSGRLSAFFTDVLAQGRPVPGRQARTVLRCISPRGSEGEVRHYHVRGPVLGRGGRRGVGNERVGRHGREKAAFAGAVGLSGQHVTTMLKEAVSNKQDSNSLCDRHPNVLAVNLLLTNAEAAEYHDRDGKMIAGCTPELPDALDVLAVANCGIDASVANLRIASSRSPDLCCEGRWLEAEPDDGLETRP